MRIHGIHLQGLRSPPGDHRLELDPGYNVVVARQAADGLSTLVRALLSPAVPFTVPAGWLDTDPSLSARIGLSLSVGADFYQLFADLRAGRVAIGKLDARDRSFVRVGKTSVETASLLRTLGFPDSDIFLLLHTAFGDFAPEEVANAPQSVSASESRTASRSATVSGTPAGAGGARVGSVGGADPAPAQAGLPAGRVADERADAGPESDDAATAPPSGGRAQPEDRAGRVAVEREQRVARRDELAARAERLARVQRDLELAKGAIRERGILAELTDDFDSLALHYKAQLEIRQRELASVERARRGLLDERLQLRGVPRAQRAGVWLGLTLGVSGIAAGVALGQAFYALGVFGGVLAVVLHVMARQARRRLGKVEAKLSGLRVRERSVEQSFESETRDVTAVLESLGLETIDELYREVADFRGLLGRAERLESDRREAARTFDDEDREELVRLEWELDAGDDADARAGSAPVDAAAVEPLPDGGARGDGARGAAPTRGVSSRETTPEHAPEGERTEGERTDGEDDDDPIVVELPPISEESPDTPPTWGDDTTQPDQTPIDLDPRPPTLPRVSRRPAPRPEPDTLVRAAEQASRHPAAEVRDRLAPSLPLYLRALTGGRFSQVRRRNDLAWVVRRDDHDKFRPVSELEPEDFARFGLAVRLAILEGLAPGLRTPLLVGPGLPYSDPQGRVVLARALRRLSSAVQVVHIADSGGEWTAQAARVHELDT